jgi:16S rRNA (guanine527-N7)-methyltransferase
MSNHAGRPEGAVPLETIATILAPFRTNLSDSQLTAVQRYLSLLLSWNRAMNLTAIDDPAEILARHFGESLFAANFLDLDQRRLADVGTGPGFPGLPLKIAVPEMQLTLIEANLKKCAFLTEVSQRLELADVEVMKGRFQEVISRDPRFEFVCSRALGSFSDFVPWARAALSPGGAMVLWLGTEDSLRLTRHKEFAWEAPIPIPESRRRVILVGRRPQ